MDDYVVQRRPRRNSLRSPTPGPGRSEPAEPRASLGVIPFGLLMTALALLAIMIIVAAIPGRGRQAPSPAQEQNRPAIEMDIRGR